MKRFEPHSHAGRNVSSMVVAVLVDEVVGNACACIDDQYIVSRFQVVGRYGGSQPVHAQCLGTFVQVVDGDRCLVVQLDDRKGEFAQLFPDGITQRNDRCDDASLDGIFVAEHGQTVQ